MAEDEDGVSNKKSPQNSENEESAQENEQNVTKPDLGVEEKCDSIENGESSSGDAKTSSSKLTGATRKDGNPFSFRHFLKRDLSLPGSSTYENTGARPKIYASTVQHSPTRIDVHADSRREKSRSTDIQAKDKSSEAGTHRISDNTSSSSSIEIPFSVVDNSDSKHNFYIDNNDVPYYNRPNLASEPLGMPSLPDFVQDHILVEQAYLNANGPISVDLDNLPDFTFNTNYSAGSSSSLGRGKNGYGISRGYNYEAQGYGASASNSSDMGHGSRIMPLDLPTGAEAAGTSPLDMPPHLNLDLTKSINQPDVRNPSFPLDLPSTSGGESMRLPDFLPVHPGRTSPEPDHQDQQLQEIISELERTRSELLMERSRRCRLEEEVNSARESASLVRAEAAAARASEAALRARLAGLQHRDRQYAGQLDAVCDTVHTNLNDAASRATEAESTVTKLKNQIKKLKDELRESRNESQLLRSRQSAASTDLQRATIVAETSLRDLLAGLQQLRELSKSLDPT